MRDIFLQRRIHPFAMRTQPLLAALRGAVQSLRSWSERQSSLRRRSVAIAALSGNEWRANLMGATFLPATFKTPLR